MTTEKHPDIQKGMRVDVTSDNELRIMLLIDGVYSQPLILASAHAGRAAANLLAAARVAHQKSGRAIPDAPSNVPVMPVDKVRGGHAETPDHKILLFQCGDAAIGFSVSKNDLKSVGETFLALSVEETKPQ